MKMLLILPIASLILAQVPADHQMRGRAGFAGRSESEGRTAHISKLLNLSAAQQQKAHELFQDEAVTSKGVGDKMKAQHEAVISFRIFISLRTISPQRQPICISGCCLTLQT